MAHLKGVHNMLTKDASAMAQQIEVKEEDQVAEHKASHSRPSRKFPENCKSKTPLEEKNDLMLNNDLQGILLDSRLLVKIHNSSPSKVRVQ